MYDLIVIGSGPAGQRAAVQAAKLGKKALLIEKDGIGGSCLYTGTIPSKTLREAALRSHGDTQEELFQKVMAQLHTVIESEHLVIKNQLQRNGVETVTGIGSFIDSNSVKVGDKTYKAHNIIIATGSRPAHRDGIVIDNKTLFDSDTILKINKLPKTLAVIGAGVIGSEYASIFANLSVKVTLYDRRTTLLRGIDEDILKTLSDRFEKQSIKLILGQEIDIPAIRKNHDAVLYCMGRIGNTEELNLKAANVQVNERGVIQVNSQYQTSVSNIFAVGDIIGAPGLAASSAEQGRIASNYIFTKEKLEFPKTFPYGIYTIPEISNVGLQEADLQKEKIPFVVGRALYKELARGKILNDDHGLLKLLIHKETKKILGVHIIGTQATELVHIGQVAMALNGTIDFLVENVFNYPTLAEAYKVAAYNAYNQLRTK